MYPTRYVSSDETNYLVDVSMVVYCCGRSSAPGSGGSLLLSGQLQSSGDPELGNQGEPMGKWGHE